MDFTRADNSVKKYQCQHSNGQFPNTFSDAEVKYWLPTIETTLSVKIVSSVAI